jgi:NSS family neurotransmitter:Na+ symporter
MLGCVNSLCKPFAEENGCRANNALIVSLADAGTAFFAGFAVFGTLGYLAFMSGENVANVVASGPGLAFITYPTTINMMPAGAPIIGILFFLCLALLGIDSAFGMIEVSADSIHDKWGMEKRTALMLLCVIGFLISLIFCSGSGFYWLDIVDKFCSDCGLVPIGIAECIAVGWLLGANKLCKHMNEVSEIKAGKWWEIFIKLATPVSITVVCGFSWYAWIKTPYGGYPTWALLVAGWGLAVAIVVLSVMLMLKRKKEVFS